MPTAPFDQQTLIEAFCRYDADQNGGKGRSDSPDSGHLGWGEASFLEAYVKLYEVTGDSDWLDRIVAHFDRMVAHMDDHFGDGFKTWVTATYSAAWARVESLHNRGTGEIFLPESQVWTTRGGDGVRDAEFILEFVDGRSLRIFEADSRQHVAAGSYRAGEEIGALPPFRLVLTGKPAPGDRFRIQTFAPRPQDYVVHQGMFLYPVTRFIELSLKNRALKDRYGEKGRVYLDLITQQIAARHEGDWVDITRTAGAYRFPPGKTGRYPNRILPHNQYLALARAFLVLKDACRRQLYLDRAARMARNFKRSLRRSGRAYTWYYWDWVEGGEEGHSAVEDTSHGHIDVGFAIEACRRGLVFGDADLRRFATTLVEQMWNGSLKDPNIGHRVDTRQGEARTFRDWIDLCQWDPKVWEICWAMFCKLGQPAAEVPTILRGWRRMEEGQKRN